MEKNGMGKKEKDTHYSPRIHRENTGTNKARNATVKRDLIRRFWPNHANQTMRGKVTSLIINQAIEFQSKRMEVEKKKRRKEKTQRHRGTELKLRVERQKP